MKNIHVLPTEKPSRLQLFEGINEFEFEFELCSKDSFFNKGAHIYITSDEEIKEGDWVYDKILNSVFKFESGEANNDYIVKNIKKIILTTDQDLIDNGVQAIPDEFLEWFVKNPSCESVQIYRSGNHYDGAMEFYHPLFYKIIIPKKEPKQDFPMQKLIDIMENDEELRPKQETLEEVAKKYQMENGGAYSMGLDDAFYDGAKWQQENSNINALHFEIDSLKREIKVFKHQQEQDKNKYSEEDVIELLKTFDEKFNSGIVERNKGINNWFEQFKKK